MIAIQVVTPVPKALKQQDLQRLAGLFAKRFALPPRTSVSVSFVSLAQMQKLNKLYRKKNRPTDVLSFSSQGTKSEPELGDMFICAPYAAKEAKRRSISLREELLRLFVHGLLHLKGYDHVTEEEEIRMFTLQENLLAKHLSTYAE